MSNNEINKRFRKLTSGKRLNRSKVPEVEVNGYDDIDIEAEQQASSIRVANRGRTMTMRGKKTR